MLTIKNKGEELVLVVSDEEMEELNFTKTMTLKDIKELDNYFNDFKTCDEFSKYLKNLSKNKQLNIIKKENSINVSLYPSKIVFSRRIKLMGDLSLYLM